MIIKKRMFLRTLSVLIVCGTLSATNTFAMDNSTVTQRLSGSNRYETSTAISSSGWGQATTVIIASGLDYPDALSASSLSKSKDAPILLTEKNALNPIIITELKRLKATQAFLIGGTGVIGTGVEKQLTGLGIGITRVAGIDRYDTSLKVAEIVGVKNGIIVSSGLNFPDALSIAPIAGINSIPILLSPKGSLNSNIAAFIDEKNILVSYLVGGNGVLDPAIASSVPNSKRLSGTDRYSTNLSINSEFASTLNFDTVYLASGNDFPDALGGAALAAKNNAPIFLTDKKSISNATINFMISKNVKHVVILGGTGAVSQSVQDTVNASINSKVVQPITSVSLNKTTDTLMIKGKDTLTANVAHNTAINKTITWTSSNNAVATVDTIGNVTAASLGTAIITATTADGVYTGSCTVTVTNPTVAVTAITLSKTSDDLIVGGTDTLAATVAPDTATNKVVTWTSSNSDVATVDNVGNVTAVGGGSAIITASSSDGSASVSCNISVTSPVTGVTLNKVTTQLTVSGTAILTSGSNDTLIATIIPATATNKDLTWVSNNNSIATVDNTGKITAIKAGTAIITVITSDGAITATCAVTVSIAPVDKVTGINLGKAQDNIILGQTDTVTAVVTPGTANEAVVWASLDNTIAAIDNTGKITGIGVGTTIITATTVDGGKLATCTVTVTAPTGDTSTFGINKTLDSLTVSVSDILKVNGTSGTLTWTSSNSGVATVDSNGKVTAISAGNAVINVITADGKNLTCNVTVFNPGPGHMLITTPLINFTASYEGYRATPYIGVDSQNYTIGYGHVIVAGENYTNLTQPQAWDLLSQDLQNSVNGVNSFTSGVNLSQQQFDALVDFAYNCGVNGLQGSTLFKDIQAGSATDKLKTDFLMWVNCNGTPYVNLYQRRTDEWQIYTSGNYIRDYPQAPNGYK